MTDIETDLPCARGCTWDSLEPDEAPRPKPAKHGVLCNSCFYRIRSALELIPDLMANMRAQLVPFGAQQLSERVSGGGDGSPAPLNIGPLDAADSLWAKLCSWADLFSEEFGYVTAHFPAWANDREVQGLPTVAMETTHRLASQMAGWFRHRDEQIAASPAAVAFHDDLIYGWEDARGVFSLSAAYGVKARPTPDAEKRGCPICGAVELFVKRPDAFDPDVAIMCGRCAHVLPPDTKKYAAFLADIEPEKEQVNG